MSADDIIFTVVVIFTLALTFFSIFFVMSAVFGELKVADGIAGNVNAVGVLDTTQLKVLPMLDYAIFAVLMGLALLIIITGWFIGGNPIFMFIYFIVVMGAGLLSAILSNVWVYITTSSALSSTLAYFPITNYIMLHFVAVVSVVGVTGLIVMFAKPFIGGGQ